MKFSVAGEEKGDLLIQVTAQAGTCTCIKQPNVIDTLQTSGR